MKSVRKVLVLSVGLLLVAGASEASAATVKWRVEPSPSPGGTQSILYGVSASSATNAWAVGCYNVSDPCQSSRALIEHYDGTSWQQTDFRQPGASGTLYGVKATSATNAWAVGSWVKNGHQDALIEHNDGTGWSYQPSVSYKRRHNALYGVAASSASNAWAVGGALKGSSDYVPIVEHFDGSAWSLNPPTTPGRGASLNSVTIAAANDVWVAGWYLDKGGEHALLERWDGTDWFAYVFSDPTSYFSDISATSPTDVWAVGSEGGAPFVLHFDGGNWRPISPPPLPQESLHGVKAFSGDVWVVGSWNPAGNRVTLIYRFHNNVWTHVASPNVDSTNELFAVGGTSSTNLFAVGYDEGTSSLDTLILHRS